MTTPRTPEWYAERCAKMREAKNAKKVTPEAAVSLAAKAEAKVSPPGAKKYAPRTGPRVQWSFEECKQAAAVVAALLLKQGIHFLPEKGDRVGTGFLLDAVRAARTQEFTHDRRRAWTHRGQLSPRFIGALKAELKHPTKPAEPGIHVINGNRPGVALPAAVAAPAPVVSTPAQTKVEPAPVQTVLSVGDAPTEILVATLVSRLFRMLEKSSPAHTAELEKKIEDQRQFQELLTAEMSEMRKQLDALTPQLTLPFRNGNGTHPPMEPAQRARPRVAVLGCRKDQFDEIVRQVAELGIKIDLKHYDQDQKPVPFTADWAISLRWVRHHWDDQMKNGVPRGHFTFIRGGVGLAVQQLKEWFLGQPAAV